ncbi:Ger(x)C family spore germination protein [Halobacillus sp. B23F22_1]|uniref:Ger(x)C family spore germination protein n=1 Tax=Halobacillus sp. B23F22_1 TaxID=3459514 RepID=UPI00373F7E90
MKKISNKISYLLLTSCLFAVLTGCWDSSDIDELSIVMGMGIDKSENDEEPIKYTSQIASSESNSDSSTVQPAFQNVSLTGSAVHEIIRNLSLELANPIFAQHLKVLILNESIAQEYKMSNLLNQVFRDNVSRMSPTVYVTSGEAQSILEVKGNEDIPSTHIEGIETNRARTMGLVKSMRVGDVAAKLTSNSSFLLQNIDVIDGKIKMNGAGVIKGHEQKLIGFLNKEEVEGVNWVTGNGEGGLVKVFNENKDVIIYELQSLHSTITPQWENDTASFHVKIKSEGWISEDWTYPGNSFKEEKLEEVERLTEDKVKDLMEQAMNKAQQEYKTDVAEFSESFRIKYPKEWEKIKADWDQYFAQASITYDVEIKISSGGAAGSKN